MKNLNYKKKHLVETINLGWESTRILSYQSPLPPAGFLCAGESERERERGRERRKILFKWWFTICHRQSQSIICVEMMPPTTHATLLLGEGGKDPQPSHPLWLGNLYNRRSPGSFVQTLSNPLYMQILENFLPENCQFWMGESMYWVLLTVWVYEKNSFFSIENICWHLAGFPWNGDCDYWETDYDSWWPRVDKSG